MEARTIFRIEYPSGNIQVDVGSFFGTAETRKIKKLLQLASENCSLEQREDLLSAMNREDRRRKEALDEIAVLELRRTEILTHFFESIPSGILSSAEKQLQKQRAKIAKSIELLDEVWPL